MDDIQLTAQEFSELKKLHKQQRDKRLADRIKALILFSKGWSSPQIAEVLLVDATTIRDWRDQYQQGGTDELLALHHKGSECKLNNEQLEELAKHLEEHTYIDSNAIRAYIKKKYKVEYSASGIKDLLDRLDFVYKKPKHVPCKLDPQKQKEFVAEYESLLETKGENDPVYFFDACHPQYNSIPAYGWIRRGTDTLLKSNSGRKRVNIHGALNIHSMETVVEFTLSVTKESTLRLCRRLEAKHPDAQEIHVYFDGASYYTSNWLKEELRGSKIVIHYLPSYSPNLNLIERLWKFFKKKVLYNQYYEKYEDFVKACKGFFRCRTRYKKELRTLLTENFQLYENK